MAVQDDESGPAFGFLKDVNCALDSIHIIRVADPQNVPSVGEETRRDVLRESNVGVAFNSNMIVVKDPTEVVEAKVACQRCGFRGDTLHHAAVTHSVNIVIEELESAL
jgi:hypothetical protein